MSLCTQEKTMTESPGFSEAEQTVVHNNSRIIIARLADRAYTVFDEVLRNSNERLEDFDPHSTQHMGNTDPKFEGLRPGYSRDWGGSFGFHSAVMTHQREQMKRLEEDPDGKKLLETINAFILSPDSGLVAAGASTPETDAIVDFATYQRHINGTNRAANNAYEKIGLTVTGESQSYSRRSEDADFDRRALDALKEIRTAHRIFSVMRTIRDLSPTELQRLNQPTSEELIAEALEYSVAKTSGELN